MMILLACVDTWDHGVIQVYAAIVAMSMSVDLQQLGSLLMSMLPPMANPGVWATTCGLVDV